MKRKRKRADADADLTELDTQGHVSDHALILRVAMVSAVENAGLADAEVRKLSATTLFHN
jgi:hypothetical protein